jgi:hypothetical protein
MVDKIREGQLSIGRKKKTRAGENIEEEEVDDEDLSEEQKIEIEARERQRVDSNSSGARVRTSITRDSPKSQATDSTTSGDQSPTKQRKRPALATVATTRQFTSITPASHLLSNGPAVENHSGESAADDLQTLLSMVSKPMGDLPNRQLTDPAFLARLTQNLAQMQHAHQQQQQHESSSSKK